MTIKIFSDGADRDSILEMAQNPIISGFTTNPTLMRRAGVKNYERFARVILESITDRPISFEVFSDEFEEMKQQAKLISSWGKNVFVKIPITNTKGESSLPLVKSLGADGVQMNITAVLTLNQISKTIESLCIGVPSIISIFAGRIADTGVDPCPFIRTARSLVDNCLQDDSLFRPEVLWASPRELLNIKQAEESGADIITVPPDMLRKMSVFGKDLNEYSLETVKMFHNDAVIAGYTL